MIWKTAPIVDCGHESKTIYVNVTPIRLRQLFSVGLPATPNAHAKRAWAQSTPLQKSKSLEENSEECKS